MIATEIIVEPNSEAWFEERKGNITASEMNSVFAKGKDGESNSSAMYNNYATRLALERITGKRTQTYKSSSMEQGNEMEELAAVKYMMVTGSEIRSSGFFKHNTMPVGASPDRLVNEDGGVQIKCPEPTEHYHTLRKNKIPSKYWRQIITELWLSGRDWWDYASMNADMPANSQLYIKRIWRKDVLGDIEQIENQVGIFNNYVEEIVKYLNEYNGNKGV